MPRLVQSPAFGLLSLLTTKDGGIGPNALLDEYRATIDARPLLGFGFRRHLQVALVVANINAALAGVPGWLRLNAQALAIAAGFRVPANELYRVISFGVTSLTVTGNISFQLGWDFTGNGGVQDPTPMTENVTNGAGAGIYRAQGVADPDFWAGPGQGPAVLFPIWAVGVNDADIWAHLEVERYTI